MKKFFISFEHVLMFIGKISLVLTTLLTFFLIGHTGVMIQVSSHLPALASQYFSFYFEAGVVPQGFDPLQVLRIFRTNAKNLLAIGALVGFILFMVAAILLGLEHFQLGRKNVRTSAEQQKTLRRLLYSLVLLVVIKLSWFIAAGLSDILTMMHVQALQMM